MLELDELEDLFDDLDIDGPTPDQLYKIYGIFLRDFDQKPLIIKGKQLTFNRNRSNHPLCKGKFQCFEHIITRESKIAGRRNFDRERSNKLHWIRPILSNVTDSRIKCFEKINDKRENQHFYWYEEKSFIVILREINSNLMLITSFSVDKYEKNKFRKWYEESNKK
ncbi:hypothetical protein P872_06010 [Rhodonellum psychrophilum GCM71 = DSM 17998]|uniref:Phage P1-related protein n=2 Tax=Rhodonellum TaxID=336827 RepID=U5C277_9BACT|nr:MULTISPECIES: hypothetical protein [Rhodonellum]ERM83026.1 hypothetical protein P872_06010 [Rhodonellum psychrophilum GCM71 = DSM 17998]SDZ47684.1 hypothetical protein SAMN05444412_11668 [Rhodonellum ikkaensis]